jgi:hypothetical protein
MGAGLKGPGLILAEGDIEAPVQPALDPPATAPPAVQTARLPTVFDRSEIERVFAQLEGTQSWSPRFCTAPDYVCSKACGCASRTWKSRSEAKHKT